MSSRWPRPIGIIESIALMPVWSGSVTGWRKITPGALRSKGISVFSPSIAPRPSSGLPSGSTTRPIRLSFTPIAAILPVRRTTWPSLTASVGPMSTPPTLSVSRFITTAITPLPQSSSSPDSALSRPYTRTTPSLTCRAFPISSNLSSCFMSRSCPSRTSDTSLTFRFAIILIFCF